MSDLILKVNGDIHRGWTSVRIRRSLESIADSFSLSLTDSWGNDEPPREIKTGDKCEISIDGEKIITGYIDNITPEYNATEHSLSVSGRSKAGDLVDCSLPGKEFNNRTLLQIATELCSPFDINVTAKADIGGPFVNKQTLEEGQPIFEFIETLARVRAVRIVSDMDGNIEFVRAGTERINTSLTLGENIKSASGEFSSSELFSQYVISGQQKGNDNLFGDATALTTSTVESKYVERFRPTLLLIDGAADIADCKSRGEWQRNTSFGRSRSIIYTVLGWHHDGGLWAPNKVVPVNDVFSKIKGDRLIVSVDFLLDDDGERVEIQVMPKEAFDLIELPEPKDDDAGFVL